MSGTPDLRPIPTPLVRRLAMLREKFLPLCVWLAAIAMLIALAANKKSYVAATGTAEARAVSLSPLDEGTVQSFSVDLLDDVQEGEVLALMDDTLIVAELRVAEAELAAQRAALDLERQRLDLEYTDARSSIESDIRGFIIDEEAARLDYLDRVIEQETNRVRLQRLAVQLVRYEKLLDDRLIDQAIYDETRIEHDSIAKQITESEAAIALAAERRETSAARLADARNLGIEELDPETFLAPVRAAVTAQEAVIAEVKARRTKLALRAPIDGRISQINYRAGETVVAGIPLLTITDPETSRVIAYLSPGIATLPQAGDSVEVVSSRVPNRRIPAKVLRVGHSVELMPEHLWSNNFTPQRGIPVLVDTMAATNAQATGASLGSLLIPGEVVNVRVGIGTAVAETAQNR